MHLGIINDMNFITLKIEHTFNNFMILDIFIYLSIKHFGLAPVCISWCRGLGRWWCLGLFFFNVLNWDPIVALQVTNPSIVKTTRWLFVFSLMELVAILARGLLIILPLSLDTTWLLLPFLPIEFCNTNLGILTLLRWYLRSFLQSFLFQIHLTSSGNIYYLNKSSQSKVINSVS